MKSRGLRLALGLVAVSVAVAAWWRPPAPPGRAEPLPMDGLTATGPDARLERIGGGPRLVSFGPDGALLGIPVGREVRGRRLRLALADVEGLAWAGVSLWREGQPESDPVSIGRAFPSEASSLTLDVPLPDGAHRAVHVELRPRGASGRFTLQSIELVPPPRSRPPAVVRLTVALLAGGAAAFAWLVVSAFRRRPSAGRRVLALACLLVGLGMPALLVGALALEGAPGGVHAEGAPSALARAAELPTRLLDDLRLDLRQVGLQSQTRAPGGLPRLDIHLSPQALATLEARRDEALEQGILIVEEGDEVDGYLSLDGGDPVRIRTRLKGDWVDHLAGRAFSLRVRVRGKSAVLGMRRFSIQRPQTRVGHYEAIVLEQMRAEGIIAPRYDFVRFSLNGEEIGVMAVEEFMSRELLEANRRREGVILALDEDNLWRQRRLDASRGPGAEPGGPSVFEVAHHAPVRTFQEGAVLKDPALRSQYAEAMGLLRGYLEGRLAPEDVFDVVLLGRFFAIANLWNADHPLWWHNVRVYFNPVTRLLEPVAFDINVRLEPPPPGASPGWIGSDFYQLGGSLRFLDSYHEAMGRLREEVLSGDLPARVRRWEAAHYARLGPGDFEDAPYPEALLRSRIRALERATPSAREVSRYDPGPPVTVAPGAELAAVVNVFWTHDAEGFWLEFQNVTDRPVTIERLEYRHRRLASAVPLGIDPFEIPPGDHPGRRVRVAVPHDPLDLDGRLLVVATLDGRHADREVEARRYFPAAEVVPYRPADPGAFLESFEFVTFDPERGYLVSPGRWEVDADLLVPGDAPLVLAPGVTLRFGPGVRMVLRTPLLARGETGQPIRLVAATGAWGGLVVLQAGARSDLRHVEIEGIAPPPGDRWPLTGAVTFYESDVAMRGVRIHGTRTEDALNIMRCDFALEDLEIEGVPSDALDVDFGEGSILRSRFLEMGGDAVDVSGTRLTVEETVVRGARDKALSVGEASTFTGRAIDVSRVGTGIASKDGSFAILTDSRLADVAQAAFMAYVKKAEFGPARLVVRGTELLRVGRTAVPVGASTVEVDGWRAPRVELDVDRLYRTGYMAK